jgi:hypothetical protein
MVDPALVPAQDPAAVEIAVTSGGDVVDLVPDLFRLLVGRGDQSFLEAEGKQAGQAGGDDE